MKTIKIVPYIFLLITFAFFTACPDENAQPTNPSNPQQADAPKPATIKGRIVNSDEPGRAMDGVKVAAVAGDAEAAVVDINPNSGQYEIKLDKPGEYHLKLKTPVGVVEFNDPIIAEAGKTIGVADFPLPVGALPPVDPTTIQQPPSTVSQKPNPPTNDTREAATVSGKVYPDDAEVAIMIDGSIVAKGKAQSGEFAVSGVNPGIYTVEITAAGYAPAKVENVAVSAQGATAPLDELLLYQSPIDGVDYDKGTITATGIGKPNPGMPAAQAQLMACRAAQTVGYRDLLQIVLSLKIGVNKTIKDADTGGTVTTQLQGVVQGAKVVKQEKLTDGSCGVTLQIPIYGPSGITKYVKKLIKK